MATHLHLRHNRTGVMSGRAFRDPGAAAASACQQAVQCFAAGVIIIMSLAMQHLHHDGRAVMDAGTAGDHGEGADVPANVPRCARHHRTPCLPLPSRVQPARLPCASPLCLCVAMSRLFTERVSMHCEVVMQMALSIACGRKVLAATAPTSPAARPDVSMARRRRTCPAALPASLCTALLLSLVCALSLMPPPCPLLLSCPCPHPCPLCVYACVVLVGQ